MPKNLTTYIVCENVTASKQAIIHVQVYDMDRATGKNVTITTFVKQLKILTQIQK